MTPKITLLKGKEQEDLVSAGLSLPCHTSFDSHNLPLQPAVIGLILSSHIKIFEVSFIYLNHIPNEAWAQIMKVLRACVSHALYMAYE